MIVRIIALTLVAAFHVVCAYASQIGLVEQDKALVGLRRFSSGNTYRRKGFSRGDLKGPVERESKGVMGYRGG